MATNETSVTVWFKSRPCVVHSNGSLTNSDAWTIDGLPPDVDSDTWHEVAELARVKFDYLNNRSIEG